MTKADENSRTGMDRRTFLTVSGTAGAMFAISPVDLLAGYPDEKKQFLALLEILRKQLVESFEKSKVLFDNTLFLHSPCISETYRGIWPDDFLYPLMGLTSIVENRPFSDFF
jgi:hypothetical protein